MEMYEDYIVGIFIFVMLVIILIMSLIGKLFDGFR